MQALLGFEHKLTHLDGRNITLSREGVTQPGTSNRPACIVLMLIPFIHRAGFVDVVKGEGMPIFGTDSYGDLYVEYKVVLPLELSPKMRRSKFLLKPILMNLTA